MKNDYAVTFPGGPLNPSSSLGNKLNPARGACHSGIRSHDMIGSWNSVLAIQALAEATTRCMSFCHL